MSQIPIILLKDGTEQKVGKSQIIANIDSCLAVADSVRTTLGPRGMDKLVVDSKNKTTISNDGATILKVLDVVYPAATIIADIARSQDAEVGDGTTSVVLLACELLKNAKPFVEDGVNTQLIIRAYNEAAREAIKKLQELSVKLSDGNELHEMLIKCAATTLSSKLVNNDREHFARMVVDAIDYLDPSLPLKMIGIKKISGGSITDSRLVKGVTFKKAFSYAGFEMQPKRYDNARVCLLNIELELKAERTNAEVRISKVADYEQIINAEWTVLYEQLEKIHASGAKIVLSRLPIGDVATQWFADRDLFCAGRIPEDDMNRVQASCGGTTLTTVSNISDDVLGRCETFYEEQIGSERFVCFSEQIAAILVYYSFNVFEGGASARSCTLILRGGAEQFIAETERSLHDAIMIVRRAKKNDSIIAGGGAIEMELSKHLRDAAKSIASQEQFFWKAYAKAFEVIPQQLCFNAGLDGVEILNQLRSRHQKDHKWDGVDIHKEAVADNYEGCVWEPALTKKNAILSATEAACIVLSIDQTVKNPGRKNEISGAQQALQG